MDGEHSVLIVDDETGLADLYAVWLEGDHTVETANSGHEALEKIDADTDIVFLDRRMPEMSGDEVLAEIRARDLDCRVAMVTGVNADFDIVEMPFDEYLAKPVSEDELRTVFERLQRRSTYDDALQEYFSLVSRRAALEADKLAEELEESDEYRALVADIERLEDDLDALAEQLDEKDSKAFISDL